MTMIKQAFETAVLVLAIFVGLMAIQVFKLYLFLHPGKSLAEVEERVYSKLGERDG